MDKRNQFMVILNKMVTILKEKAILCPKISLFNVHKKNNFDQKLDSFVQVHDNSNS